MSSIVLRNRVVELAPWLLLGAALLLPAGIALRGASRTASPPALADFGVVPDFSLVERSGRTVSRADLAGAPWFADFVFTHCADSCPKLSAEMARLAGRVGDRARLVSFSVDPERDTPAVLAAYASKLEASPDRWLFLTGDPAVVRRLVVEGFRLSASRELEAGEPAITHSDHIALVDAELRIRRYYMGGEGAWIDEAVRDLETLERR